MSGGSFGYSYYYVNTFINELELKLKRKTEFDLEPETVKMLKNILALAKITSNLMKETEWMYSSDTGEAFFMKEAKKNFRKLERIKNERA